MKTIYWENFYKKFDLKKPSNFAKFVLKKIKKKKHLLEIGCGNARDTFFFIKNDIKCIAYDTSIEAINRNKKKYKKIFYLKNICSIKYKPKKNSIDYIYARFFLHAINEKEEDIFFFNSKNLLKKNGTIFLEFRTTKDSLMKKGKKISRYERITDHYRRFINTKKLITYLKKKYNFKIIFYKTSNKYAIYKKEKPNICRLIIKK